MKEIYRNMQSRITADEALIERMLAAAEIRPKRKPILKYTAIAAAAACLVILGSVPVLAANVPVFYEALYRISPETAQLFKPIRMSCEDQGIRMEVTAVIFSEEDNSVQVYLTVQDLEGDRLDLGTDMKSSFRFGPPDLGWGAVSGVENLEYNAETRTLTVLLESSFDGVDLKAGDKLSFHLQSLMGHEETKEYALDALDLSEISLTNEVWEMKGHRINAFSTYGYSYGKIMTEETAKMVKPTLEIATPVNYVTLTGIGYIDGELHIQTQSVKQELENYVSLKLKDPNGTEFTPWGSVYAREKKVEQNIVEDRVFHITEEELRGCELYGTFTAYTEGVVGDWEVTFALPNEE